MTDWPNIDDSYCDRSVWEKRYKNEKDLAEKFQLDEIKCYSLVPGVAKEISDFRSNLDYSFMSSFTLKKELEKVFC